MKGFVKFGTVAGVLLASTAVMVTEEAHAATIGFDDFTTSAVRQISNTYNGLNWNNFYATDGERAYPNSGYENGAVSSDYTAFNGFGAPAEVSTDLGTFTFNSAYLTAAWNNNLSITIQGFNGLTQLFSQTVTVGVDGPQLFDFNWSGINRLRFTSAGGTNAGLRGSGVHFAMDNFTFNEPSQEVPTPALLPGLIGMGVAAFSKKRKGEAAAEEA